MSADGAYELIVTPPASRALSDQLPESVAAAVIEFLTATVITEPRRVGEPLRGELTGIWSARRGTYRILYRIREDPRAVIVLRIEHRRRRLPTAPNRKLTPAPASRNGRSGRSDCDDRGFLLWSIAVRARRVRSRRGRGRLEREPERASFGVAAHRPLRPGMNNASTQSPDLLKRRLQIRDREVRQRCRVPRTSAALVYPNCGVPAPRLPATSLGRRAFGQLQAEQRRPEPPGAIRIVGGKLDQPGRAAHRSDDNARAAQTDRLDCPLPAGGRRPDADPDRA